MRERPARPEAGTKRMGKRKAALALSASVMGLGTAAVPPEAPRQVAPVKLERRKPASVLKASETMLQALLEEEGARRTVYRDVAGYPTVGIGHLVSPGDGLQVGDRVSKARVLDFLQDDIAEAERAVARLVGDLPLHQHEFDALVDLVFNVGEGNVSEERSPGLNAAIAARDYDAIANELRYHHAAGHIARGLIYRSERRENIFTEASYVDPREIAGERTTEQV